MVMTDKEKALKRFEEWERFALEDEETVKLLLKENGPANQICFHVQQIAEKYLKGYLSFHKNIPLKVHQLNTLVIECKKYDDSFNEIDSDAQYLSEFYIEARYPGDIRELSMQDAKEGYEVAKRVKDFVLSKIKL